MLPRRLSARLNPEESKVKLSKQLRPLGDHQKISASLAAYLPLRRHIRPALAKVKLGWVDFKVMRRTNASLRHSAKVDPKVSADQRGHGIGVSIGV